MLELLGARRGMCHDEVASPDSHQSDRRLILAWTRRGRSASPGDVACSTMTLLRDSEERRQALVGQSPEVIVLRRRAVPTKMAPTPYRAGCEILTRREEPRSGVVAVGGGGREWTIDVRDGILLDWAESPHAQGERSSDTWPVSRSSPRRAST